MTRPDIHGNGSTVREWTRTIESFGLAIDSVIRSKHLKFRLRTPTGPKTFVVATTPSCPYAVRRKLAELRRLSTPEEQP